MDLSEEQWVERLQDGDEQALAELFSLHRARLWRLVDFRLDPRLSGRVDADDVLQEAYLAAAERIGHFLKNPPGTFFVWLRLIVLQTLVDVHRQHLGAQMRDANREISLNGLPWQRATSASLAAHLLANLTSPSQAAMRAEMTGRLEGAIDQMKALDREVLALRHFEELTNQETAEVLGIEQKAASIRYIRAIRRLKEILVELPGFSTEV